MEHVCVACCREYERRKPRLNFETQPGNSLRHSPVTHAMMLLLNFGDQKTWELCVYFPFLSLRFSSTFAISVFESSLIQILGTTQYSSSDLLSFQVNPLKLKDRILF